MDTIISQSLDLDTANRMAALFESLSDLTRLRTLCMLMNGEVNVGEVVQTIGLSKSAISHQLQSLRDKRVIRSRKQGRQVYITLDDHHIGELFQRWFEHGRHE